MTSDPRQLILIVDDVPVNAQRLAEALRGEYRVKVAAGGNEALAVCAGPARPDLILLNVMLPDLSGHEVCRRLRSHPGTRDIPILFVIGRNELHDEELGLRLGAIDYIVRPTPLAVVRARVRNYLGLRHKSALLESVAMLDGLTHLPNRHRFEQALLAEWRRVFRSRSPLSLILAEIDYFKLYNDYYGHGEGDRLLQAIAAALARSLNRPGDLLARFGSGLFAAVLPETDFEGALHLAHRMRDAVIALDLPHAQSPLVGRARLSLGVSSMVPDQESSAARLLACADDMLRLAMQRGHDRVEGVVCRGAAPA